MVINSFKEEYDFLSNFYPCEISYLGIVYPTAEHAYQSAKTNSAVEKEHISKLSTAGQAKRFGRALDLRYDWEEVKLSVMYDILLLKFSSDLADKLLATGTAYLVEGNHWGDSFWGVCDGKGENHLGQLLMEVRARIRGERHARES